MTKQLRCTASSLVLRDLPNGKDTRQRILRDEVVTAHGESYDHGWVFVTTKKGRSGWSSARYFQLATAPGVATPLMVVPQAAWGAKGNQGHPIGGARGLVVVHHFATPDVPPNATAEQEQAAMRGVEKHHEGKGWQDIGYNFVIFPSGRIYEGRGWGRTGAHTEGKNSSSVGVCFGINGDKHELTHAAIASFRALTNEGVRAGHLTSAWKIGGHRDYDSTSCPGDKVYAQLAQLKGTG